MNSDALVSRNQVLLVSTVLTKYSLYWITLIQKCYIHRQKHLRKLHLIKMTQLLTHRGGVTAMHVSKLTILCSDNGLLSGQCQAIFWTNAGILLIRPLGTHFSEIWSKHHTLLFKKTHLKMSSAKWQPSCLCLNVLKGWNTVCLIIPR